MAIINGTPNDDVLRGDIGGVPEDDTINGFGGNDDIDGYEGADRLYGGEGDDMLFDIWGSAAVVDGGEGTDFAAIFLYTQTADINFSVADNLDGTPVTLPGGKEVSNIERVEFSSGSGNDQLTGGALDDNLDSGAGFDTLIGGGGDDWLISSDADVLLDGGPGTDTVLIYRGTETRDITFALNDNLAGTVTLLDGTQITGFESVYFWAGSGNDQLTGGALDDYLGGGAGTNILTGGGGSDAITGSPGSDTTAVFSGNWSDYQFGWSYGYYIVTDLRPGSPDGGDWTGNVAWHRFADGESGRNPFAAPPVITSDGGGNTAALNVAENTTALTTVTATDPYARGMLTYSIAGGADQAKFSIDASTGALSFVAVPDYEAPGDANGDNTYDVQVRVSDGWGGGRDTQSLAVTVTNVSGPPQSGGAGADTLTGTSEEDILSGGSGNDFLYGGSGDDNLNGGNGADVLAGEDGVDVLYGDRGNDILAGGNGADTLYGEQGNDRLTGGAAADTLSGGAGADIFDFDAISDSGLGANADLILDFSRAQGDKIDLSTIDANTLVDGDQAFAFIGSAEFSGDAGQLRYDATTEPGTTKLFGDVTGDGTADFEIHLAGTIALSAASDFLL